MPAARLSLGAMVSRWRKKPVVIDAWQFLPAGDCEQLPAWIDPRWFYVDVEAAGRGCGEHRSTPHMLIPTPEGTLRAELTDWIIRGVNGEVYPCKADVFAVTYEPV
jgi:hypothetical protein